MFDEAPSTSQLRSFIIDKVRLRHYALATMIRDDWDVVTHNIGNALVPRVEEGKSCTGGQNKNPSSRMPRGSDASRSTGRYFKEPRFDPQILWISLCIVIRRSRPAALKIGIALFLGSIRNAHRGTCPNPRPSMARLRASALDFRHSLPPRRRAVARPSVRVAVVALRWPRS